MNGSGAQDGPSGAAGGEADRPPAAPRTPLDATLESSTAPPEVEAARRAAAQISTGGETALAEPPPPPAAPGQDAPPAAAPVAEAGACAGPPGIPALGPSWETPASKERPSSPGGRRRAGKRRPRQTLKIPDDSVPVLGRPAGAEPPPGAGGPDDEDEELPSEAAAPAPAASPQTVRGAGVAPPPPDETGPPPTPTTVRTERGAATDESAERGEPPTPPRALDPGAELAPRPATPAHPAPAAAPGAPPPPAVALAVQEQAPAAATPPAAAPASAEVSAATAPPVAEAPVMAAAAAEARPGEGLGEPVPGTKRFPPARRAPDALAAPPGEPSPPPPPAAPPLAGKSPPPPPVAAKPAAMPVRPIPVVPPRPSRPREAVTGPASAAAKPALPGAPVQGAALADRPSAPRQIVGILTDDRAVGLIMPVPIRSDLPPMEPLPVEEASAAAPAAPPPPPAHGPPPLRREAGEGGPIEEIEEITPDRVSIPAPALEAKPAKPAPPPTPRRPLPPPRAEAPESAARPLPPPAGAPASTPMPGAAAPSPAPLKGGPYRAPAAEPSTPTAKREPGPWWAELFDDDFIRTLGPLDARLIAREVDFIERTAKIKPGARLLDLCCGLGAHSVEFAARGYQVVACDLSAAMLARAAAHAQQRSQKVNLVQGDMRQLNLEAMFEAIICWSTSFGYFDDLTNADVLRRIQRALLPGGKFLLDMANRDYVASRAPTMAWFEVDGCVCMDEVRFDFYTSRMSVKRMAMLDTGRSREVDYSIRLYGLHELGQILHQAGFRVLEVSGHMATPGAYFGIESERVIILAERAEAA